jgi:hypothetical protein
MDPREQLLEDLRTEGLEDMYLNFTMRGVNTSAALVALPVQEYGKFGFVTAEVPECKYANIILYEN